MRNFKPLSHQGAGLGCSYSVLVLAILESWISGTRTVLVLMSSKVIVLVHVLVLGDKYSGTRTSTGLSTDILWYIWHIRMKTIIPVKYTVWLSIQEKFQIDLFCYDLNIWYMGCNCKFRNVFNSLRPRQNERHFADDIFKCIFLNENVWIPIKISLKFVPQGPINKFTALVQIMAWRRPGDKPLSGPMMVRLPTHICVTRPQWVKFWHPRKVNWIDMMKFVFIIVICPSPLSHSTSG